MKTLLNQSEISQLTESLIFCGLDNFKINSFENTNVVAVKSLRSAKLAINALIVLNHKAVLHNPSKSVIEVIFN